MLFSWMSERQTRDSLLWVLGKIESRNRVGEGHSDTDIYIDIRNRVEVSVWSRMFMGMYVKRIVSYILYRIKERH